MIAAALLLAAASTTCASAAIRLIGAWSDVAARAERSEMFPDGDSLEYDFEVDRGQRIFREYLHQRPGSSGTWRVSACRLTIATDGVIERYHIRRVDRARLVLVPVGGGPPMIFKRIGR